MENIAMASTNARWVSTVGMLLMFALFVPAREMAAQSPITGSIAGYVTDEKDQPLPGVAVTVREVNKAQQQSGVTDRAGYYIFPVLEPGTYSLTWSLQGYHNLTHDQLSIGLNSKVRLDVKMTQQTRVAETLTVVGTAPAIEPTETAIKKNITNQQFDDLPILGRDFQSIVDTLPGVNQIGRNLNISGSRENQNIFLIDGTRNDDLSNSSTRFRNSLYFIIGSQNPDDAAVGLDSGFVLQSFNQDAIGEIQVITSAYSAEYGQGSGGVVNLITRSGTDRLNGGATFNLQSDNLNNNKSIDDLRRTQESIFFGGPIVKGRDWFFASYERDDYKVGFDLRRVAPVGGPYGGKIRPFAVGLGIPQSDTSRDRLTGKVTSNPGKNNALNVTLNYLRGTSLYNNAINRASPADIDPRHGKDASFSVFVNDFQSFANGNVLYSLAKAGRVDRHSTSDLGVNGTQPLIYTDSAAGPVFTDFYVTGTFGELIDAKLDSYEWKETYAMYFNRAGRHALKVGSDWERFTENDFVPQHDLFVSENIDPNGLVVPVTTTPAPTSSLFTYFASGTGSDERFDVTLNTISLFLQDDWNPTHRWAINAGLRYDHDDFLSNHEWSPRLHTAYDVLGNGRFVLRGGAGIFRDRSTLLGLEEQVKQQSRFLNIDKATGAITSATSPAQSVFLTPDFQSPITYQANAGFEYDLTHGYIAGMDVIYKDFDKLVWTKIINEPPGLGGAPPDPTIPANSKLLGNFGTIRDTVLAISLRKQTAQGTYLNLNYTFENSRGNTSQELAGRKETVINNFLEAPDQTTIRAPADFEIRHALKFSGVVKLPLGFDVSPIMKWRAGRPWTPELRDPVINGVLYRNVFIAPEGINARRLPEVFQLDLRVQKRFQFGSHSIEAYLDGFNVTNRKNVASVQAITSFAGFGEPVAYLMPRTLQIGGKYRF
jgi:outer membrane receptor for ferrienterochelin and colicin